MKNLKITTTILALTMAFTMLIPSAFAIGVSPLRAELKANPGESVEGTLQAFNSKDAQQVVVLTKGDFLMNDNQDVEFYSEVIPENSHSMMDWIVLPEENTPLEAKGGVEIKYTINVPADAASQSYYGVIFVSSEDPDIIETNFGVGVTTNVAHLILLEVDGGLVTNMELENFEIEQDEAGAKFITSLKNKGNTHDATSGQIIITDKNLDKLEEINVNKSKHNSLPGVKKVFTNPWEKFSDYEPGTYFAYPDLKDEADNPLVAELKFKINDKGEIQMLNLEIGRSYEDALKDFGRVTWLPFSLLGLIIIFVLFSCVVMKRCKLKAKKSKRKTKK